jgi:hypothetical protein
MVALLSAPTVARAEGLLASAARLASGEDGRALARVLRDLAAAVSAVRLELASLEDRLRIAIEPVSESIRERSGATAAVDFVAVLHDLAGAAESQLLQIAARGPTLDPRAGDLLRAQTDSVLQSLGRALAAAKAVDMSPVVSSVQMMLDAEYDALNADPSLAAEVERALADIDAGRVGEPESASELTDALHALAAQTH